MAKQAFRPSLNLSPSIRATVCVSSKLFRICRPPTQITLLLFCINVPYHVIRQTDYLIARSLGHLSKAFCFSLILEGIRWEVDACSYNHTKCQLSSSITGLGLKYLNSS